MWNEAAGKRCECCRAPFYTASSHIPGKWIDYVTQVSMWLKGRVTWTELYNMEIGPFHYLHCMVLNQMRSEEGKKAKQEEMMSDAMEDALT